jgi:hypothetical protein
MLAAAPELFEALENLVSLAAPHFSDDTQMIAISQARAALDKARGAK